MLLCVWAFRYNTKTDNELTHVGAYIGLGIGMTVQECREYAIRAAMNPVEPWTDTVIAGIRKMEPKLTASEFGSGYGAAAQIASVNIPRAPKPQKSDDDIFKDLFAQFTKGKQGGGK